MSRRQNFLPHRKSLAVEFGRVLELPLGLIHRRQVVQRRAVVRIGIRADGYG